MPIIHIPTPSTPPSSRTPAMVPVHHPPHHYRHQYHPHRSIASAPSPPPPSHIDAIPVHQASLSPAFHSRAAPNYNNLPSSSTSLPPPPPPPHDPSASTTDATSYYHHQNHRRCYQAAEPVIDHHHHYHHVRDNNNNNQTVHRQGLRHHHTVNHYADALPLHPHPSPSTQQDHDSNRRHQPQTITPIPLFSPPTPPASSSTSSFSSSAPLTAPSFLNPTNTATLSPTATTTATTATTTSSHLVTGSTCGLTKVKVCGWCGTSSTSQWRVGPTTGSIEMATLCNACGINYRRALGKTSTDQLDLDVLALQTGRGRLSIQKALKRVRKQSAAISNIGVFSQHQQGRAADGRYVHAAAAASQVAAPGLTPTTPQGRERGGRSGSGSRSMDMMMAGGITNDALRAVHLQQQETVIEGATGRRSGLRSSYVAHGQHAAAYGHSFEQGLSLEQTQAPPRREKIAVTALLQQQQQDCGPTASNYEKEAGFYGTRTGRPMSTPSSSDRYTHGHGHAPLTPAVCKGGPYSVSLAGHGDVNEAQQQQQQGPLVKRQRGKIDVASLLQDDESSGVRSRCISSSSTTSAGGGDDDMEGVEDGHALARASSSSIERQGMVKANSVNHRDKKITRTKTKESNGTGTGTTNGGKYLPSPPMSRVSSNGSSALCVRERGNGGGGGSRKTH